MDVQLDAARKGRGIARVLSYQASADLESGALVRILRSYEPRRFPVHIVMAGGRQIHLFDVLRRVLPDIGAGAE